VLRRRWRNLSGRRRLTFARVAGPARECSETQRSTGISRRAKALLAGGFLRLWATGARVRRRSGRPRRRARCVSYARVFHGGSRELLGHSASCSFRAKRVLLGPAVAGASDETEPGGRSRLCGAQRRRPGFFERRARGASAAGHAATVYKLLTTGGWRWQTAARLLGRRRVEAAETAALAIDLVLEGGGAAVPEPASAGRQCQEDKGVRDESDTGK